MMNKAIIFWDDQDTNNIGWAWRSADGSESGSIDNTEAVEYLHALNGGAAGLQDGRLALAAELSYEGIDAASADFVDSNGQHIGPLFP